MDQIKEIKDEEMLKFPQRPTQAAKAAGQAELEAQMLADMSAEMEMQKAQFQPLDASPDEEAGDKTKKLDMLMSIHLPVSIELGRTQMEIREILDLKRGSIVEFDKMAGEPVDIVVNGKKMAEGEVVVIDKQFAIRVTSLTEAGDRIRGLGK
jgi:flagellar motor switch protein FliN/FliY